MKNGRVCAKNRSFDTSEIYFSVATVYKQTDVWRLQKHKVPILCWRWAFENHMRGKYLTIEMDESLMYYINNSIIIEYVDCAMNMLSQSCFIDDTGSTIICTITLFE